MTSDLLFSILPREGKVPITTETQKVEKINKSEHLKPLSDEEQELHVEEKEARQQQQQNSKQDKQGSADEDGATTTEYQSNSETNAEDDKKPKGPKHLDIYV
ncbi:hypothetical protein RS130_12285 [Paraglaciecola aquimarina]|uniref:Uncharacterized protein n=1 Tax=Paraglaciecola aquimarina TaxID=1235557 RepID=A0ABU3SX70_9ALTE|nr:hypothetical protein [Paraglaciecola aquimarina]MDU0354596.1 hypothetical protein [Paraglaciecola aquimarina]